jgi:hypothetical protein
MSELAERGLQYGAAAQVRNIEAAPFPGVSLVDYDVLLVDQNRVEVGATTARNFTANLGQVADGVVLKRGWVAATVTIHATELTLASTHLESGNVAGFDQLRALQMQELVGSLNASTPAVLLGDLNDAPGSPMYQVLVDAGFSDLWRSLRPGVAGNTCCHEADLSNKLADFDQRLDFIFGRGLERDHAGFTGQIQLLGEVPADRISGPVSEIWPSDHAGVAAELVIPSVARDLLSLR